MNVDVKKFRALDALKHYSEDQKDELIHMVARLVQPFVDKAFGEHPVQLSLRAKSQKLPDLSAEHAKITANSTKHQAIAPAETSAVRKEIP